MQKNPSCATCTDGIISVEVNGPLRPFEFRIKKIAPTVGAWSSWATADTFSGRVRTFTGLGVGVYQIDIDTDNSLATQDCIRTAIIELTNGDPCAADCDSSEGKCENALQFTAKSPLNSNNFPEQVLFKHIPQYNVGESELTVEMWIKPDVMGNNMILWDWSAEMKPFFVEDSTTPNPGLPTYPAAPPNFLPEPPVNGDFGGMTIRVTNFGPGQEFCIGINCNKSNWSDYNYTPNPPPAGFYPVLSPAYVSTALKIYAGQAQNVDYTSFNHLVFVIKDIAKTGVTDDTGDLTIAAAETGAGYLPVFKKCFEVWLNGIQITTVQGNTMNSNDPKSTLTDTDRDFIRNFDNLDGGIRLNTRVSHMEFASSQVSTNFRQYSRALSGKEIQRNYLGGCKAEPSNCSQLMIYAPLNQTMGAVTQERIYGNHGQLIGYAVNRTNQIGGTSSWVQACCPKIADFDDYNCGSQDCNPDFVEMTFKITGAITAVPHIVAIVPGLDACPIPTNAVAASLIAGIGSIFDISAGPTTVDMADILAWAINDSVAFQAANITAISNLNSVTVRMPLPTYTSSCGLPLSVCLYSGTTLVPVAYTGTLVIEYPRGKNAICCVDNSACSTEDVTITV